MRVACSTPLSSTWPRTITNEPSLTSSNFPGFPRTAESFTLKKASKASATNRKRQFVRWTYYERPSADQRFSASLLRFLRFQHRRRVYVSVHREAPTASGPERSDDRTSNRHSHFAPTIGRATQSDWVGDIGVDVKPLEPRGVPPNNPQSGR
jgi:hypothetical protein